ncbi:MAG TPA: hypothetical protein VEA99_07885 [Gemmatimonadaceae bacterium]|nr:hypothetical protein [Gemmatimonadaceae bacterium]
MNRLLALVAVACLGTGCIVEDTCEVRSVVISWPDFHRADGELVGCAGAGVSAVRVWMDGLQVLDPGGNGDFPCAAGGLEVTGVFAGVHDWSVEGTDSFGRIVNRDTFSTAGDGCGTLFETTRPAQGRVDLRYQFYAGGAPLQDQQCVGDFLWLSIYDVLANDFAALSDLESDPEAYTCGGDFVLELPVGSYVLDWMEESGPSPDYDLQSADCTDRTFAVYPGTPNDGNDGFGTPVPVRLARDATDECARRVLLKDDSAGRAATSGKQRQGPAPIGKALDR